MGTVVDNAVTILSTVAALAFVLVLAYVILRWMGQKMPTQGGSHQIQVLDRMVLGRDKCLLLVRVAEKTVLVGMSNNSVDKICDVDDPEGSLEAPVPESFHFADFLKESLNKGRQKVEPEAGQEP